MRFADKVAIVTGAGTGLGAATTLMLARAGADVVTVGRRAEKLEQVAATARASGAPGSVAVVPGDVADPETAVRACAVAVDRFGGLDVLVNNAGLHSKPFLVHETPVQLYREFLDVDLLGPFLFTRAAIPHLLDRGGGAIVNIASMVALVGFKYSASYSSAKGGLVSLTKATAADYGASHIRANCICPGGMQPVEYGNLEESDRVLLNDAVTSAGGSLIPRVAHVDEVAELVLFLSGPASGSLTGAVIPFDSGFTAH